MGTDAAEWESDATAFVHCGSFFDPYDSMALPQQVASPVGDTDNVVAVSSGTRVIPVIPDLDAVLDLMEKTPPSPTDPAVCGVGQDAVDIYLRDMPIHHPDRRAACHHDERDLLDRLSDGG